ncbi:NAD(P)-dependent alcohol dehydrogenase [Chitinophaga sp.]|uniref:NAD(P)-dependent alcohol dehydrogenase n=1 Tax=Chitinophaga sp. TaxID=1869181 RepID=UPI0031DFD85F
MRKLSYSRFGGTEVLEMVEAPMPAGEIVVKVKAVSVNPLDWKLWQGEMKMMGGRKFPKEAGIDFSGVVVKGNGQYKDGDEVLGITSIFKGGAMAEYVAVKAGNITHKPAGISFEEAAALPVAGGAATQIFGQLVLVKPGMKVLINGAAGGIGPFAIQLAKQAGGTVTAVVGPSGVNLARESGSDVVVNYKEKNVLTGGEQYDVVVDLAGKMDYKTAKRVLSPAGVYVNTSPGIKEMIGKLFAGKKYQLLFLKSTAKELEVLAKSGLKVAIGKRYRFEDFKNGYDEVRKGGIVGKAVFIMG